MSNIPPWQREYKLYKCYWLEDGEEHKGFAKGIQGAYNEMCGRLQKGLPSWIKYVTESELEDDIPF